MLSCIDLVPPSAKEQKINQEEAAERCGLHRTYCSGIKHGTRNVSLVNIGNISKGLKKSFKPHLSWPTSQRKTHPEIRLIGV